ncbi:hypothetical protein [Arthrobacter sp. zg-Y877]|uniref:hypothetical protein n=1 Tax=Arthrobacter sp. zg-Y877 TaxID=3049074 RepID=UPI0025A3818B|nr:hypothetical protein [Arthrobacter sp. zg-Y877]MDM7989321.1 hypothetical protein [Arthrobacter sp. zg-Y877]
MRLWTLAPVIAGAVVLSMVGCGAGGAASEPKNPQSDRWNLGVTGPRSGPYSQCLDDPSIEESLQSADFPSSHLGIRLVVSATAEDAQRIADCLKQTLSTGEVSISGPGA